ncbi:MAG: PAS domain-containing protein [Deltaproteobacteria bacterium]|nr:PAS domain-containing protein [Deltaproteobacteria bacterium]
MTTGRQAGARGKGLGLTTRLLVALCLVAAVPTVVLGVLAVENASRDVEREVSQGRAALVRALGHDIERRLDAVRRGLELTGQAWVRAGATPGAGEGLLAELGRVWPLAVRRALFTVGADGVPGRVAGDPLGAPPLELTYGGYVGEVAGSSPRVPIAVQTRGRTGGVVGLLVAEVELGFVQAALDEARLGEGGSALVIDGAGQVIARTSGAEPSAAIPRALAEPEEGHAILRARGVEQVAVYRTLWLFGGGTSRAVRWSVVLEQPTVQAFALARRTARITIAVGAGVLALAALLGFFLAKQLVRPLRRLTAEVEALAAPETPDLPGGPGGPGGSGPGARGGAAAASPAPAAALPRGDEVRLLAARFADMTTRLGRTRAELLATTRLLADLVERLPIGVVALDGDGVVRTLNPAMERLTGRSAAELVGRVARTELPARDGDLPLYEAIVNAAAGDAWDVTRDDARTPMLADKARRLRVRVAPLERGGAVILHEDLSDRARLESELLRSEKLASVGLMAAGIAHEINNPLTSILGYAKLLLEDRPADAPDREALALVAEEARRVQDIVRGLLDYARAEPGRFGATDVNASVTRTLSLMQPELKKRRVRLDTALDPELPRIAADARRIEQVFVNLLQNAAQAMASVGDGERGGTMTVTTRWRADHVEVVFEDTGPGIAAADLPRIFDPFFTTKGPGVGTGLGLALSREIVVRHGGRLECESTPGAGTRFTVVLPAAPAVT